MSKEETSVLNSRSSTSQQSYVTDPDMDDNELKYQMEEFRPDEETSALGEISLVVQAKAPMNEEGENEKEEDKEASNNRKWLGSASKKEKDNRANFIQTIPLTSNPKQIKSMMDTELKISWRDDLACFNVINLIMIVILVIAMVIIPNPDPVTIYYYSFGTLTALSTVIDPLYATFGCFLLDFLTVLQATLLPYRFDYHKLSCGQKLLYYFRFLQFDQLSFVVAILQAMMWGGGNEIHFLLLVVMLELSTIAHAFRLHQNVIETIQSKVYYIQVVRSITFICYFSFLWISNLQVLNQLEMTPSQKIRSKVIAGFQALFFIRNLTQWFVIFDNIYRRERPNNQNIAYFYCRFIFAALSCSTCYHIGLVVIRYSIQSP